MIRRRTFAGPARLLARACGLVPVEQGLRTDFRLVNDLMKYPELRWLDRFDILIAIALGVAMFGLGALLHTSPELRHSPGQMLVWGSSSPPCAAARHLYDQFPVACVRQPALPDWRHQPDNWWLAILTLGEGWHNNHHHTQFHAPGFYWWEYDITFYGLKI
jgi:stearoyl-CoA desaturase (delta-9 desaturase)